MNLRDLEYVVSVADLRSVSRAARHCSVSQPTLSTQLKKLEQELGVVLFERTNRKVQATEVGEQVIAIARRILRDTTEIKRVSEEAKDPLGGSVRLCAIPTLSSYLFPKIVEQVRLRLPEIKLILSEEKTEQLLEKLSAGEVDFGLVALPVEGPSISSRVLFHDPFLLAVSENHELAQRKSVSLQCLKRFELLLLEEGHCLGEQALAICASNQLRTDSDLRGTSLETLKQMVRAETGITLVPRIAAQDRLSGIRYIPFLTKEAPGRVVGLVWRKSMSRSLLVEYLCTIGASLCCCE